MKGYRSYIIFPTVLALLTIIWPIAGCAKPSPIATDDEGMPELSSLSRAAHMAPANAISYAAGESKQGKSKKGRPEPDEVFFEESDGEFSIQLVYHRGIHKGRIKLLFEIPDFYIPEMLPGFYTSAGSWCESGVPDLARKRFYDCMTSGASIATMPIPEMNRVDIDVDGNGCDDYWFNVSN